MAGNQSHEKPISFCIAARNEENTLADAVLNIRQSTLWEKSPKREILICVNGSTDGTMQIARELMECYQEIALVEASFGSKGHAWNRLVRASNPESEMLCFLDADVEAEPDAFEHLLEKLNAEGGLVMAGACAVPFPIGEVSYSWVQRCFVRLLSQDVITERRIRIGLVSGCCYVIRRSVATQVSLPEEPLIGDDTVLNGMFPHRKCVVPEARVKFTPPDFLDRARVSARHRRAFELLRKLYPPIFQGFRECYSKPFRRTLLADFRRLPNSVKFSAIFAFSAMVLGTIVAKILPRKENQPWHSPESTKKRHISGSQGMRAVN